MGTTLWKPTSPTREPWKVYGRRRKRSHYATPGNGDLEDGEQGPLIPLEDVSSLPREEPTQANEFA